MNIHIPKDIRIAWERDFCFLGCSFMARQHLNDLRRYLGVGYSMCAFFHRHGQVKFYRSESDEERFDKTLTEKLIRDEIFSDLAVKKLHELTDDISKFVSTKNKLNKNNIDTFTDLIDEHFAYHLAIFWPADYINRNGLAATYPELMEKLEEARRYNEQAIPCIEKWLVGNNQDLILLTPSECRACLIEGVRPTDAELKSRDEAAFVHFSSRNGVFLSGEEAIAQEKRFDEAFVSRYETKKGSIKGQTAFPGTYKGTVRVITEFANVKNLKAGEILVTQMTRPQFNQYVKNAGAIITDEGAVLCHAAIIAREFKIPCIVGTKIATKVLKDGDMVEVDAEKGIIRI